MDDHTADHGMLRRGSGPHQPSEVDRVRARAALRRIERAQPELVVQLTTRELDALIQRAVERAVAARSTAATQRYLTTQQVAEMLGVGTDTVQKWHRRQGLPAFRIGRVLRFRRNEVERWLDERATDPRSWTRQWAERAARLREA